MAANITFSVDLTGDNAIREGATFNPTYFWTTDGVAVNLSSVTAARMQLRTAYTQTGTPLLDLTIVNGGIVITAATGAVQIVMTRAQTLALYAAAIFGVYDLELTWADGTTQRFMEGSFSVKPEVTK